MSRAYLLADHGNMEVAELPLVILELLIPLLDNVEDEVMVELVLSVVLDLGEERPNARENFGVGTHARARIIPPSLCDVVYREAAG